jgi:hypothetical protein
MLGSEARVSLFWEQRPFVFGMLLCDLPISSLLTSPVLSFSVVKRDAQEGYVGARFGGPSFPKVVLSS